METAAITSWTLIQEIPIPDDVKELLIDGEEAVTACKTFRDSAVVHYQAPHRPRRRGAHRQEGRDPVAAV